METRNDRKGRDYLSESKMIGQYYITKSKNIIKRIGDSKSRSNSRISEGSRTASPVGLGYSHHKLVDTKKYLDMKKQTGGIFGRSKSPVDRDTSYASNMSNNSNFHSNNTSYNNYLNSSTKGKLTNSNYTKNVNVNKSNSLNKSIIKKEKVENYIVKKKTDTSNHYLNKNNKINKPLIDNSFHTYLEYENRSKTPVLNKISRSGNNFSKPIAKTDVKLLDSNYLFDKEFNKKSEISDKIKNIATNKLSQQVSTEHKTEQPQILRNSVNILKDSQKEKVGGKKLLESKEKYTNIKPDNFLLQIQNSPDKILEKNNNYIDPNSKMNNNISNKQTADSNKSKISSNTFTLNATNPQDELVSLFNRKLEIEEVHFISVMILQNSRRVVRQQEKGPEKDNLFSTVTNIEERDL